jgi:hypothetical protein
MLMRQKRRIQVRVFAVFIVAVLCMCATLFLALATYLALRETMSSIWAALATAAASLLVALLGWLVAWHLSRRRSRDRREPADPRDMLEEALQSYADPMLSEWARRNPDRAVVASALLGVAAGYSAPVRRLMRDLYCPTADQENRRGKREPD